MLSFFDGKKTYLTGFGMVLASVGGLLKGSIDLQSAVMGVLNGLGFIFLRKSLNTSV